MDEQILEKMRELRLQMKTNTINCRDYTTSAMSVVKNKLKKGRFAQNVQPFKTCDTVLSFVISIADTIKIYYSIISESQL